MVYGTVCWAAEAFVYLTLQNVLPPSQNYRLRIIVILGMSTTTNKQGKKTKIAPQCLCHVLFSRSHSKFQIHTVAGGRLASTRLAAGPFRRRRVVRSLAAGLWTVSAVVVMWPYITFIIQCVIESLPGQTMNCHLVTSQSKYIFAVQFLHMYSLRLRGKSQFLQLCSFFFYL